MGMGSRAAGAGAFGEGTGGISGMGAAGGGMSMGGMAGVMGMAGQSAPMGGYGSAGGAYGGGLFGSMGRGGDLSSNSEFELNRESRGGILSVWSRSSPVVLQRPGRRVVAQPRRGDDDLRGRLLARRADGGPAGGPHPRPGRLPRHERRPGDIRIWHT